MPRKKNAPNSNPESAAGSSRRRKAPVNFAEPPAEVTAQAVAELKAEARNGSESHPSEDAIRRRAYAIWQSRGGTHGNDQDDWWQAERELSGSGGRKIA